MTAAQTADRIIADGIVPTEMKLDGAVDMLRGSLVTREIPVIVADNVASYVAAHFEKGHTYVTGDWPSLAPPWDRAFLEYTSGTGRQRRGVYFISFDFWKATPDERSEITGMIGGALKHAQEQFPDEVPRWALGMVVFVDDLRRVAGPIGCVIWILDSLGKELGNRWFMARKGVWGPTKGEEGEWLNGAVLPALQTVAFMHCKNVVVDHDARPDKLARSYRKKHGHDPMRWQTVRLELPRQYREGGQPTKPGSAPDLHIVTGHFSHYGNCCPTQHEPKGKLFGRLEGVYWMPQHLRGDPNREVRSDKVIVVRNDS